MPLWLIAELFMFVVGMVIYESGHEQVTFGGYVRAYFVVTLLTLVLLAPVAGLVTRWVVFAGPFLRFYLLKHW